MVDMLELGQQVLAQQPFSHFLGATLTVFSTGSAELVIPIRDEYKQQNGFAHGGLISYLADKALTFAGGSVLGTAVLTLEFKINYMKPAIGESLVARATVLSSGKRQAVCRCDIFARKDGAETFCATAQGTILKIETNTP